MKGSKPGIVVAVVVAGAITAGCGMASTTVGGTAMTVRATETVTPTPYRDGALEFVVLDTSRAARVGDPDSPGLSMNAKGVFLVVTLSIRNLGEVPVTVLDRDQTLIDNRGNTFLPNMAADIYANPEVHSTRINPGGSLVVRIVFDVPGDTVPIKLLLRQSSSSRGVAVALR